LKIKSDCKIDQVSVQQSIFWAWLHTERRHQRVNLF